MKKLLLLFLTAIILTSCAESMVSLSPMISAGKGNVMRSSLSSVASFGVKKQTGKTPVSHALDYAKNKNNEKIKDLKNNKVEIQPCVEFLEPMSVDMCNKIKSKILQISKVKNLSTN